MRDDETALRDAFADGVPTPPPSPDRSARARAHARRRRTRRTTGVVVGAVVAVGLAVGVPVVAGGRDGRPAPARPGPTAVAPALECPAVAPEVALDGPTDLGGAVTGARLCSGPASGFEAPDVVIGAGDATDIAGSIDRLDPLPPGTECTQPAPRPYVVVFGYADGSTRTAYGDTVGCDTLTVGGVARVGAQDVLDTTLATARGAQARTADPGCPPTPALESTGPDRVGADAVVVRLCRGPGLPVDEPVDALRRGVDELVAAIGALPVRDSDGCRADLGPGYSLVVGYPDGSTQVVTAELAGCRAVWVGGVRRDGPQDLLDTYARLLRAQRDPLDVVVEPDTSCDAEAGTTLVGRSADITSAVLCAADGRSAVVDRADLATLLADLRGGPDPLNRCARVPQLTLVGSTGWGDRVEVHASCDGWVDAGVKHAWSPASRDVIERLLS